MKVCKGFMEEDFSGSGGWKTALAVCRSVGVRKGTEDLERLKGVCGGILDVCGVVGQSGG